MAAADPPPEPVPPPNEDAVVLAEALRRLPGHLSQAMPGSTEPYRLGLPQLPPDLCGGVENTGSGLVVRASRAADDSNARSKGRSLGPVAGAGDESVLVEAWWSGSPGDRVPTQLSYVAAVRVGDTVAILETARTP